MYQEIMMFAGMIWFVVSVMSSDHGKTDKRKIYSVIENKRK